MHHERKKITCRIRDGRIDFTCPQCRAKRKMPLRPNENSRTITCQKCGTKTSCALNRRRMRRESQTGRIFVEIDGRRVAAHLRDISDDGIGFTVPRGHNLFEGQILNAITCDWNPRFPRHKLIVRNVVQQKIGAQFDRV